MATTHSCAIAALQSNAGQEDLGAARHATRTLTHRHALNEQNYKRAQRALAGQALRAARLHGTRQLNADEVIGARQSIGASAVQGRGINICKNEKIAWRRTQPYAVVSTAIVNIAVGGAPYGATTRIRGVPNSVAGYTTRTKPISLTTPDGGTQPFGPSVELPMGPRNVRGVCRNRRGAAMRAQPFGPSVGLPVGPRTV